MDEIEIAIAREKDIAGINYVNKEHRKAKAEFITPSRAFE